MDKLLQSRNGRPRVRKKDERSKTREGRSNSNPTEKEIEKNILEYLYWLPDCFAWKNNTTGVYDPIKKIFRKPKSKFLINGVSDIIGVYKGRPLFLEVKTPKTRKRLTEAQQGFLLRTRELGAISAVVTSIEDVQNALKGCDI